MSKITLLIVAFFNLIAYASPRGGVDHPNLGNPEINFYDHSKSILNRPNRICNFEGNSFGALTTQEFLQFKPHLDNCRDRDRNNTVVSRKLKVPILAPLFPVNLPSSLRTFSFSNFAFLFPIIGNVGRNYSHYYIKEYEDEIDKQLGDISERDMEQFIDDYQDLFDELEENERLVDQQTTKQKRGNLIERGQRLIARTNFPFDWDEAKSLSSKEMWSYHSYNSVILGPSLSGSFITKEGIDIFGHLGGALVGANAIWSFDRKITVRKINTNVDGVNTNRIQLKFEGVRGNGRGFSIGGSPFGESDSIGHFLFNTTFNALTGSFLNMAGVYLLPVGYQRYRQNEDAFTFVLEFDTTDDFAKEAYEQAIKGNFEVADRLLNTPNLAGLPSVRKVFQGSLDRVTKSRELRLGIPPFYDSRKRCTSDNVEIYQEFMSDLDFLGNDYEGLQVSRNCKNTYQGILRRMFVGRSVESTNIKSVVGRSELTRDGDIVFNLSDQSDHDGFVLVESVYEDGKINRRKFNKIFEKFETLDTNIKNAHDSVFNEYNRRNFDLKYNFKFFFPLQQIYRFLNMEALEYQQKVSSFTSDCGNCDLAQVLSGLGQMRSDLASLSNQDLNREQMRSFFTTLNRYFEGREAFQYIYALFKILNEDFSQVDYVISLESEDLEITFPLVIMSPSLQSEFNDVMSSNTNDSERVNHLVLNNPHVQKNESIYKVSDLKGLNLQESIETASALYEGDDSAVQVSCDCYGRSERERSWGESTKVSVVGLESRDQRQEISALTQLKLGKACYDSEFSALNRDSTGVVRDLNYVKIDKRSCETRALPELSSRKKRELRRGYESLQTRMADYLRKQTSCSDNFLVFKDLPDWLRVSFSTLIAGVGWEIRGEGHRPRGGALTGMAAMSLVSFVSANSCRAFVDGLIASSLLFAGENMGWGDFFDMGIVNNNPNHYGYATSGRSVLFHDLPGMTVRGAWITALASSYLQSKGYDFRQDTTGDILGYVYYFTRQLSRLDGGHPDVIDSEFLNVLMDSVWIRSIEDSSISDRRFRLHIELAEFLTGTIIGYELSRSLINAE